MNNEPILELFRAIRKHSELEIDDIISAANHGADGGFAGFTYNSNCIEFYDNNSSLIQEYTIEQAEKWAYKNWMEMVIEFNRSDMLNINNGYKILLSWYILEQVGWWLEDNNFNTDLKFMYEESCTIGDDFLMLFCDYTYGMDDVYMRANNGIDLLIDNLSKQGYFDDLSNDELETDDLSLEAEDWLKDEGVPYDEYNQYGEVIEFAEEILRQVLDQEKEKKGE